jgi:hypothetical protein
MTLAALGQNLRVECLERSPGSQDSLPMPKFGLIGGLESGGPTNKLKLQGKKDWTVRAPEIIALLRNWSIV